ncbi:MAG: hypothetical protein AAGF97_04685 [Planctomycetota bacterium]
MTNPSDDRRDDLPEDAGASDDFLDFLEETTEDVSSDTDAPAADADDGLGQVELDDEFELNLFDDEETSAADDAESAGSEPVVSQQVDDLTFDLEETTDEGLPELGEATEPVSAEAPAADAGSDSQAGEETELFPEAPAEDEDAFEFEFEDATAAEESAGDDDFEFELELGEDGVEVDESTIGIGQPDHESAAAEEEAVEFAAAEDSGAEATAPVDAGEVAPDLKLAPAEEIEAATAPAADMAMGDLPSAGETMQVAPVVKVKRSPVITLVKIGIGALLGIVIFQIAAWWAGFDFLGLAPKLPAAVAWLAPAHLRQDLSQPIRRTPPPRPQPMNPENETPANGDDAAPAPPSAEPMAPDDTAADAGFGDSDLDDLNPPAAADAAVPEDDLMGDSGESGSSSSTETAQDDGMSDFETRLDDLDPQETADDLTDPDSDPTVAGPADSATPSMLDAGGTTGDRLPAEDPLDDALAAEPVAEREMAPAAPMLAEDDGTLDLDTDDEMLDLDTQEEVVTSSPPPVPVGPLPAKWFTGDELSDALSAAQAADERLDEAQLSKQGVREAARDFYVALANLAERFTYAEPQVKTAMTQPTRSLAARFEFDDKKLKLIGNAARQWYAKRLGQGVVLAGTVDNVQSDGALTTMSLTLLGKSSSPIVVVAPRTASIRDGQRLLVFGTMLDDAAQALPGYTGTEPRAVWEGMVYPLP